MTGVVQIFVSAKGVSLVVIGARRLPFPPAENAWKIFEGPLQVANVLISFQPHPPAPKLDSIMRASIAVDTIPVAGRF